MLKAQQKFKSESDNVFTDEINQIALSSYYDKRMQSVYSIGTYVYKMNEDLACKNKEIKCNNIIKL